MAYASKDTSAAIAAEVEAYLIANPPSGGVQLGETSGTAHRGDHGKTAYDHSQVAHAPAGAEVNVNADWDSIGGDSQILNKPTLPVISNTDYGATWDNNLDGASKKALYAKFESMGGITQPQILARISIGF